MRLHKKLLPKIKVQRQERSEQAVRNILDAAEKAFDESPESLNARMLAVKSGYSIGSLYYYFNKVEEIFILTAFRRREKKLFELAELIGRHPADKPVRMLAEAMVDSSFAEINRMHRKAYVLVYRMTLRFTKSPLAFDNALAVLVGPLQAAQERNQTGTFRKIDADELLMILKIAVVAIRRPFLEQDPGAGAAMHRALAIKTLAGLLENTVPTA